MESHRGFLPPMDYHRPRDGPPMDYHRPRDGTLPPLSMAAPGHSHGRAPPPGHGHGLGRPSAPAPPPRPIPPSSVPSLSSGQGFYTVESLQGATVVPPPQLLPPARLLPTPEPYPLPERPLDRFDPPAPRPRSHHPDERAFGPPSLQHPARLDRGRPPLGREMPQHRDLPPRDVGPVVRGGPRMRQPPPPSFMMDPRVPRFHPGREGRGQGWGPSRDFGLGRRMDRGRPVQSPGIRKPFQKAKPVPRAKSSLPAATADNNSPAEKQEAVDGWCSVCQINCFRALDSHLAGKRHKRVLEKLNGEVTETIKEGEKIKEDESEEIKKLDGEDQVMKETEDAGNVDESAKTEVTEGDIEAPKEEKESEQVEGAGTVKVATPGAGKKRLKRDKDGASVTKKRQKAAALSDAQNAMVAVAGENEGKVADNENTRKVEKVAENENTRKVEKVAENENTRKAEKVDVVETCQLCNVTCNSKAILETHLKGKKHAARLKRATSNPDLKGAVGEGKKPVAAEGIVSPDLVKDGVTAAGDLANGNAGQSAEV